MNPLMKKWIGIGALITPVCAVLGGIFVGGGHGSYLPLAILFPYIMLLMMPMMTGSGDDINVLHGVLAWIFMLFQFPLYGALIGAAKSKKSSRTIIWLLVIHVVAVVLCFVIGHALKVRWL